MTSTSMWNWNKIKVLRHVRVAGGLHCICAFVYGGVTHTKTVVQCQQLAATLVFLVSIYWCLSYIMPVASYKWNCFPPGNSKAGTTSWPSRCLFSCLGLLSFGPRKTNLFILCPWAIFSKPVTILVWTIPLVVVCIHSYCCYLISYSFYQCLWFLLRDAANCTGLLELVFWTSLEFFQINSSLRQPSRLLLPFVVHRLSVPSSKSLTQDPCDDHSPTGKYGLVVQRCGY